MYSASLHTRDKGSAIAAAIAIQAALLFAFLNLAGRPDSSDPQSALRLVDLSRPTPRRSPPIVRQVRRIERRAGGSSRKNIESRATDLLAVKAVVPTPVVNPVSTTLVPRDGNASSTGASPMRGLGSAGGGTGNGTGDGNGSGAGDGGGAVEPPHLATPVLSGYDFPRSVLDEWPRAATVFLRLRVDARGYVSECLLDRGTNVRSIDSEMCNIAHERLHFRPALNRSGQAVAGWFGYAQPSPR